MKEKGLSSREATQRQAEYGRNILPRGKSVSILKILLRQFVSPLVFVLFFAALVTIYFADYSDTIVILLAVILNTILGFYQELKAEHSLHALSGMLAIKVMAYRDSRRVQLLATDVVPGDLIYLSSGDSVPGDGVLIEANNLLVNEAMLTGESTPIIKKIDKKSGQIGDWVFMGTTVTSGTGIFIVKRIGASTQMGTIAKDLSKVEEEATPLQKRITNLSFYLTGVVAIVSAIIFVTGIAVGNSFEDMFTTAVAVAVSMIPEGMLVSITVVLAIGMQRILKKHALVRRLVSAETLGMVTVIATDKTGTLTEGIMRVKKTKFTDKKAAMLTCIYANDLSDSLESAIWKWADKEGIDGQKITEENPRQSVVPFNSAHKYMSVKVDGKVYMKGAPEVVLKLCKLSTDEKKQWMTLADSWSSEGLRLLGLSQGDKWLGLIGVEDPVREDVKLVFDKARRAGIRVIMITGDYVGTAEAVWRVIAGTQPKVIEGMELNNISKNEFDKIVRTTDIFARVTADEKLKIVQALSSQGEVVALVGDGVNDAPALKAADIGIVVGGASDVSRETADMVLIDSNFNTIIAAIEQGRGMFETIKKVVLYLLANSFSEVLLLVLCMSAGLPLAVTAGQILWINLVTDGLPNIALTLEPHDKGLLLRKPNLPEAPIVDAVGKILILVVSISTGFVSFVFFDLFYSTYGLSLARTVAFSTLGLSTILMVFSIRSYKPIWKVNQLQNPYLVLAVAIGFILQLLAIYHPIMNVFLHTVPLGTPEWLAVIAGSLIILILVETLKLFFHNLIKSKALTMVISR